MLTNPVFLSVALMLTLCALRFNVFLAILCSGLFAGIYARLAAAGSISLGALVQALQAAMDDFIAGMSGNLETSLAYILVGALAAAVARSNLSAFITAAAVRAFGRSKLVILAGIAFFSCFSQNLIPIHIAFIPVLIPPLFALFRRLQLDRRAVACAITFGITTPYITLPLGFGLIYQSISAREITKAGLEIGVYDVAKVTWLVGAVMLAGLVASMIYYGSKRGTYAPVLSGRPGISGVDGGVSDSAGAGVVGAADADSAADKSAAAADSAAKSPAKFTKKDLGVLAGLLVTLALQITLKSLPLSALVGFLIIIATGGIRYRSLNEIFGEGFALMGYVAFIMLVAAGFSGVLKATGGIEPIVAAVAAAGASKFTVAAGMMAVGLLITLGIGSSFGTVPIIAAIFVPICLQLGFSAEGIIFLIAAGGFIGDTGSPASEATLGVAVGINADGAGDHIRDVCIPTMIFYNIPLLIAGSIIPVLL